MKELFARLREELGFLGIAALCILATASLFFFAAVKPLEERLLRLDRELQDTAKRSAPGYVKTGSAQGRGGKLSAFYRFFETAEGRVVWLAKIQGIATAAGLELRTGEYRLAESEERLERYQIMLPVAGTYAQIRAFLENALAEIPMLSLDRVTLRRKTVGEPRAEAEVSLTLHLLRR